MPRLKGKIAVVTGGGSGIGEAIVKRFVEEGASVIMTDRDETAGNAVAAETGVQFLLHDVASESGWTEVMKATRERFGYLDILVNNAGIVSNQSIGQTDLDTWNRILAVNLTGAMLGCREAIPLMQYKPGGANGSLLNVASTVALLGLAFDAAYTASKAAVVGLTKSVAAWCASEGLDIRCNSLHPGATYTAILQSHVAADPALYDKFSQMAPVGRMARVEEIANLALYLASDESSYSTGGQFVVDGGITSTHPSM